MELQYETHPSTASTRNGRIPEGLAYASIKAHMERLEVVFLSRFLFEILRYIELLLVLKPNLTQKANVSGTSPAAADSPADAKKVRPWHCVNALSAGHIHQNCHG